MTDYFIRRVGPSHEVAKFDPESAAPDDTYLVNLSEGSCTCPSYTKPCKHWKMVDRWEKLSKDSVWYYDDTLGMFVKCDVFFGDGIKELLEIE